MWRRSGLEEAPVGSSPPAVAARAADLPRGWGPAPSHPSSPRDPQARSSEVHARARERHWKASIHLLEAVESDGVEPDVISHCAALGACARAQA